jgi:hypothetical protein
LLKIIEYEFFYIVKVMVMIVLKVLLGLFIH